jgi:hypothetical protein
VRHGFGDFLRLQDDVIARSDLVAFDLVVALERHPRPSTNSRCTRWPVARLIVWKAMRSEVEAAV